MRKYLQKSEATTKGNMNQQIQGIQSTKNKPINIATTPTDEHRTMTPTEDHKTTTPTEEHHYQVQ